MEIRRIRSDEGLKLRAVGLRALADSPLAFGSTLAREESFPDAIWHERAARGAAGENAVTIVAEQDGLLVGMATGLLGGESPDHIQPTIVGVFVEGAARRQGVGLGLVGNIVYWARGRGSARLYVWITSGNAAAMALYGRCGFELTGARRPSAHGAGLAELEMALDLARATS
jgi:GNAT superfamily N-acetyltransferase